MIGGRTPTFRRKMFGAKQWFKSKFEFEESTRLDYREDCVIHVRKDPMLRVRRGS